MSPVRHLLLRMFGRPTGRMGRLGGAIMAHTNRACAAQLIDAIEIRPHDAVLEVGFGPGVAVELVAQRAVDGRVAGVDASPEMVAQATARNRDAIRQGRVDLRTGTVERLPFAADTFDKALAVNSMQVWPDAVAGLREVRRVLKPGGILALAFTPQSGRPKAGLSDLVEAAGFTETQVATRDGSHYLRAEKPQTRAPAQSSSAAPPFSSIPSAPAG